MWSLREIARLLNCSEIASTHKPCSYVVDSRYVKKGDLFFALPGAKTDGHLFISEALSHGACGIVLQRPLSHAPNNVSLLYVEDTLAALQALAIAKMRTRSRIVIGITGSLGKTSCKEFLKQLLPQQKTFASSSNQNSQIGLPLTILNDMPQDAERVVLEMGMTHPGQISRLVEIAPPDLAIVSTLALVHAVNFSGLEAIAAAKGEIFSHPRTVSKILPAEQAHFFSSLHSREYKTFSQTQESADYYIRRESDSSLCVREEGIDYFFAPPSFPTKPHDHNLLAAITAARLLGISWGELSAIIPRVTLPKGRSEKTVKQGIVFVNDAYNASEPSMLAALETLPLPQKKGGKRYAVLGEMRELGAFSEACHQRVAEAALGFVDVLYCLGENCKPMEKIWRDANRPCYLFFNQESLIEAFSKDVQEGDVVLLKGSNGTAMWKVLERFSDS